jgi:hypothetical protein
LVIALNVSVGGGASLLAPEPGAAPVAGADPLGAPDVDPLGPPPELLEQPTMPAPPTSTAPAVIAVTSDRVRMICPRRRIGRV